MVLGILADSPVPFSQTMDKQQFLIESLQAPGGCLPTHDVVELLDTNNNAIKLAKQRNAERFTEGTHFHKGGPGKPNEYTLRGVQVLCELLSDIDPIIADQLAGAPAEITPASPNLGLESLAHAVAIEPTLDDEAYLEFLADNLTQQQYGNNLANRLATKMAERLPQVQSDPQQMGDLLGKQLAHLPQMQERIHQLTARFLQQRQDPSEPSEIEHRPQLQEAIPV